MLLNLVGCAQMEIDIKKLEEYFSEHGAISRHFSQYELRPAQLEMVKTIARVLEKGEYLAIEAKSGIGRILAYLLPAIYFAKTSGQKVVISDYSHTHREKIISENIPILKKIIPFEFKVATLVNRNQYFCPLRFEEFKKKKNFSDNEISFLIKILLWLPITTIGDISEIPLTFEEREIFISFRSTPLPSDFECPHYEKDTCFFYRALKKAKQADLVITSHNLLLSGKDFPRYDYLIIDQAHYLEEGATREFGCILSCEDFSRYLSSSLMTYQSELKSLSKKLENKIVLFFGLVGLFIGQNVPERGERLEFHLTSETRSWPGWQKVKEACDNLLSAYKVLKVQLKKKELKKLRQSLKELFSKLETFIQKPEGSHIYEVLVIGEKVLLKSSPIDISRDLEKALFRNKKSVVLITPQLDKALKEELGVKDWPEANFKPEFAWRKQMIFVIPKDIASPASYDYTTEIAQAVEDFTEVLGGKTLVLFTSQAQVENVYKKITPALKEKGIEVLAQRVSGRDARIIEKFRKNPESVILASSRFFWEEVHIPGKGLSGVIITKLPFSFPSSLKKARERFYVNGFFEKSIPEAILKFKQGFSRLIRAKSDRGVVLVLDSRLINESYGLEFLKALPEVTLKYCLKKDIGEVVEDFIKS